MHHYKCHVCESQGLYNQFFKDYEQLSFHFDREHFLCHDPQCLAARFVVFEHEIDLRAHELEVHGGSLQNRKNAKIQLEFKIHRSGYDGSGIQQTVPSEEDFQYGLDGVPFVPESLPAQENEPVMTDPTHAARTAEIRAEAQRIREQQRLEAEGDAFPSLQAAEGARVHQQPLVGWTSTSSVRRVTRGGLTAEDFPALTSAARKSSGPGAATSSQPPWAAAGRKNYPSAARNTVSASSVARPSLSDDDFPSFGGARAPQSSYTRGVRTSSSVPSLTSEDFPSLGGSTAGTSRYSAAEAFSKQYANAGPSATAVANILQPPPSASRPSPQSSKEQVDKIKLILGPNSYKKLKNMTKEYANGRLGPQEFVDGAASLFESGVKHPDFMSFVPSLIHSCPSNFNAARALSYLESMRQSSGNVSTSSIASEAFPILQSSHKAQPLSAARVFESKKAGPLVKSSWGNKSGAVTAAAAKSRVAAAVSVAKAAEQMSRDGTATSFMAKELAKEQRQKKQTDNAEVKEQTKIKKQEKDELRALAFGGR